jgi:hypothetical protein
MKATGIAGKPVVLMVNRIIAQYALFAALLYVAYFLIMRAAGLAPIIHLRYVNFLLYSLAGYHALRALKASRGGTLDYLQGLGVAFAVGSFSFVAFGVFIFLYSFIDAFFMETVLGEFSSARVFGRFAAPFLVAAEGIGISSILALCLMQFFKIYSVRRRKYLFFGPPHRRPLMTDPPA